jgi:hypothetical protein
MKLLKKKLNTFYFDDRLSVSKSQIQGLGLFTNAPIKKGEILIIWSGKLFSFTEVKKGYAKENSLTGFSEGIYIGKPKYSRATLDEYVNHSCNSNTWLNNEVTLAASRYIYEGEEITADYSLWEIDSAWKLDKECNCGAKYCRNIITGNDWKIPNVFEKNMNHFLPCINIRIKKYLSQVENITSIAS